VPARGALNEFLFRILEFFGVKKSGFLHKEHLAGKWLKMNKKRFGNLPQALLKLHIIPCSALGNYF